MRNDRQFQYGDANALINRYRQVQQQVNARLPQVLDTLPKSTLDVRAVEPERALTAAAAYQPSAAGQPGVLYVNTRDLPSRKRWNVPVQYLHEAIPGHHVQLGLQQELAKLPRFRRLGGDLASSKAGACTPKRWAKTWASTPIPTTASATCTRACCVPPAWWPIPACTPRAGASSRPSATCRRPWT